MMPKPTIFAVSSGSGRAGVAVIRLSGPAGVHGGKDVVHRVAVAAIYAMPEAQ